MSNETVMFTCSSDLKEALGAYAARNQSSMADVVRQAVAAYIDYDLDQEEKPTRRGTKYANPEERKKAMLQRAKARRQLASQLVAAYDAEEKKRVMEAMVRTINE